MAPNALLSAADRVRAAAGQPPTTEIGSQTRTRPLHAPIAGLTTGLLQEQEYATAWRWPQRVQTVDLMRSDAQVEALYTAAQLAVRRRRWLIDPDTASDEVTAGVAADLGLPIAGRESDADATAGRARFSWDRHLQHVLLGLLYGSYYFEQVGHIDDTGMWRLDKLAPRPPRTILYASTNDTGGLESITQIMGRAGDPSPSIPVDRLVAYVWDQEGADWYGRSMLRAIYREFDIKDRLIRVDLVKHDRNGMGVPIPHATDASVGRGAEQQALAMATALRAGQEAGGVMPYGMEMRIMGVQGQLPDTLASIKHHDETMARRFLAMFMMLGQSAHGSRALGATQADFYELGLDATAQWVCDVTTEHVIRDWVQWNYGPDEPAPRMVAQRGDTTESAVQDVIAAVSAGALTADPGLEGWLRDRYSIPAATAGGLAPTSGVLPRLAAVPDAPAATARAKRPARAAAADATVKLPDRQVARKALPFEAAAAVDFATIDATFSDGIDRLVAAWQDVRASQIDELISQIEAAQSVDDLALIAATPVGADLISEEMIAALEQGIAEATREAEHQGATAASVDVQALTTAIEQRAQATATLLARSLGQAASNQAVARSGGTLTTAEIATDVRGHLETLTDQYLVDQFTGVVSQGMNTGRRAVMATTHPTRVYASELLDAHTCEACGAEDGTEYTTVERAELSYPSGGFKDCAGGPRCRGTLVAIYDEVAPTLQEPGA